MTDYTWGRTQNFAPRRNGKKTAAERVRIAQALVHLGGLALAFGRIDRTAVYHPDGVTPESDSDHTVMLGWIAPALAQQFYPDRLDIGLVAQFALVHDAPEVYAGDTDTLRIDDAGLAAKRQREQAAVGRLVYELNATLPWFTRMIMMYEEQTLPEARFVRAVDKIMPRIVHFLDRGAGLRQRGIDRAEWDRLAEQTRQQLLEYAADFPELLELRDLLGVWITSTPGILAGTEPIFEEQLYRDDDRYCDQERRGEPHPAHNYRYPLSGLLGGFGVYHCVGRTEPGEPWPERPVAEATP